MSERSEAIIKTVDSISEIDATVWDRLANPVPGGSEDFPYNPFLRHDFFRALEQSGSATMQTGWYGQHLILERGDIIEGVAPCYLKNHSQGEYVFDHGWADALERAGGRYYPKLQCSVPFTPATGRRFLTGAGEETRDNLRLLAGGLQEVCRQMGVSSAHITFMEESEANLLEECGYLHRNDRQFHWKNNGYGSFDDFLSELSSRKRKNIRKERKAALQDGAIKIEWLTGSDLTEDVWDTFFDFYMDTGSRKWGRPYLTREFYSLIGESMAEDILLVLAHRGGSTIAGAINFVGSDTLFGRHWGCIENHPFLHFELCYYQAIDFAIEKRLSCVEAGAQGEHKLARGYVPVITHSAHHITIPGFRRAVEDYLERERRAVSEEAEIISHYSPFKKEETTR